MFTLPAARKEWRCGQKWEYGELIIDPKKGCGQWIYESDEKFESGKNMIKNSRDGVGGQAHLKHKCPNRIGSIFHKGDHFFNKLEYRYHQQYWPCSVCGTKYNKEVYPICPTCMRLECRSCLNLQHWIVDKGLDCFECGERCDPRQIFTSYEIKFGLHPERDERIKQIWQRLYEKTTIEAKIL